LLRGRGFDVVVAAGYRPALKEIESARPMITDIVMPQRVNGLALSRMARMNAETRSQGHLHNCLRYSWFEDETLGPILRKPIDEEHFIAEVQRAIAIA
jgi:CheY-like chemotaxis protein